ncbi:hypothetical protein GCM10009865_34870 [Aeromicrobium ponti]|uniref:Lipoprotein n=1 Tax=Cytobacillus oceanisediminis TaxID=665099 RepID=A0A562JNY7_9BACI|nr:hypothetical protein [Cytobacillus oceanisediminis]TWH84870.1 hypothetical protein IQ19_03458 [Cytobacillus oceanisediminis]
MKKRELRKIFASFLVASVALTACNSGGDQAEQPEENKQEEQAAEDQEEVKEELAEESVAVQQINVFAEMKAELEKMKENQEVDWDLVIEKYQSGLQNGVNEVNGEFDATIMAALEAGKSGDMDANIARQLVDKTTQSYFYQKQKSLHKEAAEQLAAGNQEEADKSFEQIKHLASEIFVPTAEKRDNYYELSGEASIAENINAGLEAQEEALTSGNADDFNVFIQLTDKSVYKSYYLASASYAEKIEAAVEEGKDEAELKNMQAEAWGFYQAIKGSLSGGDEEAANKLNELFSLDATEPASIKADEVNSLFNKAIVGKIKSYHEKVPTSLGEDKLVDAKTQALEGNMFLKALQIQLNEKLGEDKAQEAFTHAEEWFNAVSEGSQEEAKTHSDAIIQTVDQLLQ